eukprot:1631793-Rhodomonas_salina.1
MQLEHTHAWLAQSTPTRVCLGQRNDRPVRPATRGRARVTRDRRVPVLAHAMLPSMRFRLLQGSVSNVNPVQRVAFAQVASASLPTAAAASAKIQTHPFRSGRGSARTTD